MGVCEIDSQNSGGFEAGAVDVAAKPLPLAMVVVLQLVPRYSYVQIKT